MFLFIFYYIIDNTGYKLARDGKWAVWEGIWLSSAVLLPLGIFFTYKAVNDSAVFNRDLYVNLFRRFFGIREGRNIEMKEVVMTDVELSQAETMLESLRQNCREYMADNPRHENYRMYWATGYNRLKLDTLREQVDQTVDYLSNSREKMVILKLKDMPVLRNMWLLRPGNRNGLARFLLFSSP